MSNLKKNITLLFISQVSNYIFPLITLPYLLRTLGVSQFGLLAFSQAVIQYCIIFTDYGFSLSATRQIAVNRDDKVALSRIFFSTMIAKVLLALASICILILGFCLSSEFANSKTLLLICFLSVLGNVFFPIWFFQGVEKISLLVMSSTAAKAIIFISTFYFVNTPGDLNAAAFIQSMANVITGFLSIFIIFKMQLIVRTSIKLDDIKSAFREGFPLFLSSMSTTFYTSFNTVLLGFNFNSDVVGSYAAADRLRLAVQSLLFPIHQALYPRISFEINSTSTASMILKKYGRPAIGVGLAITVSMLLFGKVVSEVYFGKSLSFASSYFNAMFALPLLVSISMVFGQWILMTTGNEKITTKIYASVAVAHTIYSSIFVYFFGVWGLIFAVIITELIVSTCMVKFSIPVFFKREHQIE